MLTQDQYDFLRKLSEVESERKHMHVHANSLIRTALYDTYKLDLERFTRANSGLEYMLDRSTWF